MHFNHPVNHPVKLAKEVGWDTGKACTYPVQNDQIVYPPRVILLAFALQIERSVVGTKWRERERNISPHRGGALPHPQHSHGRGNDQSSGFTQM